MHTKRLLSIGFVVMLLMSMAAVLPFPAQAVPAQSIWVEPPSTTGLNMGDEFVVDVKINVTDPDGGGPATGLYGFQYRLKWNGTVLNAITIDTRTDNVPPGDLLTGWTAIYIAANTTTASNHTYAVSATGGVAFTGVAILCRYKFKVMYQPAFPEPDFVGALDLDETYNILVSDTATPIPHTTGDGEYTILSVVPEPPKVGVDPPFVKGVFGQTFNLDIVIEDSFPLFPAYDLFGFEFKLSYNTTVLDALGYLNGTWFMSFAGANGIFSVVNIDEVNGIVHGASMYLDGRSAIPSGSGVLMTIVFNATSMYLVPPGIPPHIYPMDLYDVMLVNSQGGLIPQQPQSPNDGEYEEPYRVLGWALDCWTDPYRKLNYGNHYYTPFTGELQSYPGSNGVFDIVNDFPGTGDWISIDPEEIIYTADAYEPQEFVKLYAKLTYNDWPEQNKIIMFEIYGPCNIYQNISIIRTAITDEFGVATINFTIPHPCEHLEDIIFGKWVCYQAAQVKDPWNPDRFKKVVDVLLWDVGWKVELLAAFVAEPTWPCTTANITIWYKNIAQVPMWVVFTFTIFDTLLDPLGEFVTGVWVPPGIYCHPYYDMLTVRIHIPKWAHVGPCAHVCVNAFTALPMQCGLPYCPEVQDHFTISLPP